MNPQSAKRAISHLSKRKVPIFLWGPPGIGKSSIIAQIAKEAGIACIDLRLSLLDPTDLRGIPFFNANDNSAVWAPASFLPDGKEEKGRFRGRRWRRSDVDGDLWGHDVTSFDLFCAYSFLFIYSRC